MMFVARPRPPAHERELHTAVAQFLRVAVRPPTTWTTIGHGGGGLARARMLQRQGLKPGWPDIILLHPSAIGVDGVRRVIVIGIELKTEIGRQSVVQRNVEAEFAATGATYVLCRSVDDVQAALADADVPMFGVVR